MYCIRYVGVVLFTFLHPHHHMFTLMLLSHDRKNTFLNFDKSYARSWPNVKSFFISQGAGGSIRSTCAREKILYLFLSFSAGDLTRCNLLGIKNENTMSVINEYGTTCRIQEFEQWYSPIAVVTDVPTI